MEPIFEQAFPTQHAVADANDPAFKLGRRGMSLRDYFAAAEKIDAEEEWTVQQMESLVGPSPAGGIKSPEWLLWEARWRAALRYMRADAMLAAREREEG